MARAKRRRPSATQEEVHSSNSLWLIGIGVLLIGLIIFAAVLSSRPRTQTITVPTDSDSAGTDTTSTASDRTTLGNPDAAITVEAWEDFLCPACAAWNAEVKPQLVQDYVEEGLVKLEFHHFPLVQIHGQNAARAAEASECAADQGAFWPYHDRLFHENRSRGQQNRLQGFVYDAFVDYAQDLELDIDAFTQCIGNEKYSQLVNDSMNAAFERPLSSTPSIIVSDTVMPNPFSYNEIKQEIDRLLAGEAEDS